MDAHHPRAKLVGRRSVVKEELAETVSQHPTVQVVMSAAVNEELYDSV